MIVKIKNIPSRNFDARAMVSLLAKKFCMQFESERILVQPCKKTGNTSIQNNFSSFVVFKKCRGSLVYEKRIEESAAEDAQNALRKEKETKEKYATSLAKAIATFADVEGVLDEKLVEEVHELLSSPNFTQRSYNFDRSKTLRAAKSAKLSTIALSTYFFNVRF